MAFSIPTMRGRGLFVQWTALLVLTALFSAALIALQLPAGLLLGAIAGGACLAGLEGRAECPPQAFLFAQALIGGMIGKILTFSMLSAIYHDAPVILGSALSVILLSCLLGWILTRAKIFADSTAIWGSLPGAASAMALMAEAYGADIRLVAFMQYARVLVVALAASLFARFFAPEAFSSQANPMNSDAPFSALGVGATCVLLVASSLIALRLRLPAGPLLLPLLVAAVSQSTGYLPIELPRELLGFAYLALGWSIGLRFTRDILRHAARALPAVFSSILALLALCAGLAFLLVRFAHVDPMTALLATSPGGVDAVAIIAVSAHLDLPFIMAVQTARLLLIIFLGPPLARLIADKTAPASAAATSALRDGKNSSQDSRN